MKCSYQGRLVLALVCAILLVQGSGHALQEVFWDIVLAKCLRRQLGPCVYYGQQFAIEGKVGVSNLSPDTLEFPPFVHNVVVYLDSPESRRIPVDITWLNGMQTAVGSPVDIPEVSGLRPLIGSQDGFGVSFVLTRADGLPFGAGTYVLTADLSALFGQVRLSSGAPWIRRTVPLQTWRIEVRLPQTREDWIAYHQNEASYLQARRKTQEALPHFEAWVQLSPEDRFALTGLGAAYLEIGRVKEAVLVLEAAFPTVLRDPEERHRAAFAVILVRSYLALGDEANARRVLRVAGRSEVESEATLARLRKPR